jgi:hypothetical protein
MEGRQLWTTPNTSTAPTSAALTVADHTASYESLPPNFSLSANMIAGAFAGIAVCCRAGMPQSER